MGPVSQAPASFEFGRFRILPQRREVLADDRPMELGGRAFDLLVALLEANGAVVSKDELMTRAWPGRIVEDSNLHAQITALRKALSDRGRLWVGVTNSRAKFGRAGQTIGSRRSLRRLQTFPARRAL